MQFGEVNFADEAEGCVPILSPRNGTAVPLEKEQETYVREREALLVHAGKFVVISGDEVAGYYDTYSDALQFGYDKFELRPFMVKQIEIVEQVHFFTRDLGL